MLFATLGVLYVHFLEKKKACRCSPFVSLVELEDDVADKELLSVLDSRLRLVNNQGSGQSLTDTLENGQRSVKTSLVLKRSHPTIAVQQKAFEQELRRIKSHPKHVSEGIRSRNPDQSFYALGL